MDAGVLLPTREMAITGRTDARAPIAFARRVEDLGFRSAWVGDSVGDSLTARPRVEPIRVGAAVAAAGERGLIETAASHGGAPPPASGRACVGDARSVVGVSPYPRTRSGLRVSGERRGVRGRGAPARADDVQWRLVFDTLGL